MAENTKYIGNLTELQCITYLYKIGCSVSVPFGNNNKYDIIIEWKNKLYKIQIKHSTIYYEDNDQSKPSYIKFKSRWQGHNTQGYVEHKYTEQDIDFFATYFNNKCYLIPQKECSFEKTLRIIPPKSGQKKGISFLDDYLAQEVLNQL